MKTFHYSFPKPDGTRQTGNLTCNSPEDTRRRVSLVHDVAESKILVGTSEAELRQAESDIPSKVSPQTSESRYRNPTPGEVLRRTILLFLWIFGGLFVLSGAVQIYRSYTDYISARDAERSVAELNGKLPLRIDEESVLSEVRLQDGTLTLTIKLVRFTKDTIENTKFKEKNLEQIRKRAKAFLSNRAIPAPIATCNFVYIASDGYPVADLAFQRGEDFK